MKQRPPDPVEKRLWITLIVLLVLLVAVAVFIAVLGGIDVAYETPRYEVLDRLGEIEIRKYEPYVVAETIVDDDLENAGSQGFRILAKYIFGDNRVRDEIAMTAPVVQKRTPSTKMSMTAPVTQTARDDQFAVQFMMPSKYARDELPVPNDDRVQIREVPARRLAAIRYSGTWSKKRYDTYWEKLAHVLAANGYTPVGEPIWARYDPPFKPWFLRRNEILTAFR